MIKYKKSFFQGFKWLKPENKTSSLKSEREEKELSQLDGAFIVADDGVVVSACRYINASSRGVRPA
ncbi:MAG: hypothetical protein GY850_25885 [bacterium]|nr:hypothetical protein [bacterium]